MKITDITALVGLVFGTAGLVLGIMNFLRDRPRVVVFLQWDMQIYSPDPSENGKAAAMVRVTNAGRRAVFVSHLTFRFPKPFHTSPFLHVDSSNGKRLEEGDPPAVFVVPHTRFKGRLEKSDLVRAEIVDSTGKAYSSPWVSTRQKENRPQA